MKSSRWWAKNWNNHTLIKEEVRASFDNEEHAPQINEPRKALTLIKRMHRRGGQMLSDADVIWFYQRKHIYLGRCFVPHKKRSGGRGRPAKNRMGTHYDGAWLKRMAVYHRRFFLPRLRKGSGYVDDAFIETEFRRLSAEGVPKRKLISKLLIKLQGHGKGVLPVRRTLNRILQPIAAEFP